MRRISKDIINHYQMACSSMVKSEHAVTGIRMNQWPFLSHFALLTAFDYQQVAILFFADIQQKTEHAVTPTGKNAAPKNELCCYSLVNSELIQWCTLHPHWAESKNRLNARRGQDICWSHRNCWKGINWICSQISSYFFDKPPVKNII